MVNIDQSPFLVRIIPVCLLSPFDKAASGSGGVAKALEHFLPLSTRLGARLHGPLAREASFVKREAQDGKNVVETNDLFLGSVHV